jgi:hypothetical protein
MSFPAQSTRRGPNSLTHFTSFRASDHSAFRASDLPPATKDQTVTILFSTIPSIILSISILLGFWAANNFIFLLQHRERIKELIEENRNHP